MSYVIIILSGRTRMQNMYTCNEIRYIAFQEKKY